MEQIEVDREPVRMQTGANSLPVGGQVGGALGGAVPPSEGYHVAPVVGLRDEHAEEPHEELLPLEQAHLAHRRPISGGGRRPMVSRRSMRTFSTAISVANEACVVAM